MVTINAPKKPKSRFSVPAYARIQDDMRRRIREGQWTRGMLLPGRLDLSREYSVSLDTLQRAVADLLEDGTLCADSRKGTYVSETADVGVRFSAGTDDANHIASATSIGTLAIITSVLEESLGITDFWLPSVIRAAEDTFRAAGGSVFVINRISPNPRMPLVEAIRIAMDRGANAIALLEMNEIAHEIGNVFSVIDPDEFPFVCTSGDDIMAPVPHVGYDSRQASYEAAAHLVKQGCDHITFFAPFAAKWAAERLDGVRQAVRDAGLPEDAVTVFPDRTKCLATDANYGPGSFEAANEAIAAGLLTGGMIAQNDNVALGLTRAAQQAGLVAGRDYLLVGFDDVTESVLAGLSTMRPPLEAMGREAAQSVINAINGRPSAGQVRLRSRLVARSSSQRI
ncbi:MAG TPA: substrate-binding domain-containing protein [Capsulimonadaceae bacterium]|jgi:DNA-binding LacI/PurR family transcriptional regulator